MNLPEYSDYIVYVDESGHAAPEPDPSYPCFVLAFCLFGKKAYIKQVAPGMQQLKFAFFGHDMVVFHEREIRKSAGDFGFLTNPKLRKEFHEQLNRLIETCHFKVISECILKDGRHQAHENLYHMALLGCLEGLYESLALLEAVGKTTHVVFEQRGKNEDQLLELEFRRICSGENRHQKPYPFVPIMASKKVNSTGLQFADLFARPIGLAKLRPEQPNRAYEIIRKKQLTPELPLTQGELDIP
jgi:hypothetical protein